jgi:galactose mutarotase-like enzyme
MIAPSGKQITIATKDQQAVVVEVGGGLRSYSVGGRELLDGYGADEMSSSGRGQMLIPPNGPYAAQLPGRSATRWRHSQLRPS